MSQRDHEDIDRYVERLVRTEISRRRMLRQAGAGALSVSMWSFLAACGTDKPGGGGEQKKAATVPKGEIAKNMTFANWPLYIDVNEKTKKRPTLEEFEKEFGTKVKYVEEVNDNTEFFGKVRQQLARDQSGGRDLFVVTDWMAAKMKQLGYVQRLDKSQLPNVQKNLVDVLKSPGFDPGRDFTVPWQSGQTAIAYRKDKTGGKLTSVNDLFDPKFKGKVTMLTEMRDTVGLVMLGLGKDPEKAPVGDMLAAIEKIGKASTDGQIRRFTGNDFTKDLLKGDAWVSVAYSGDSVQLKADDPNIEFLQPEEGFMLWTDNMQIPVGAPHAFTAQKMMDFVYRPEVQADIAEYVNYVPPVKGVKEILTERDPDLANNPLIFPDEQVLSRAKIFRELKPEEEREVDEAFQAVVGA